MKLRFLFVLLCATPLFSAAQSAVNCNMPTISVNGMNEVRESVARQNADERRLQVAKNITNAHCLSAEQVTVICRQFSSEETKVEFARFAINHTFDLENYSKVLSVFRKEANKRDITSLIKTRQ